MRRLFAVSCLFALLLGAPVAAAVPTNVGVQTTIAAARCTANVIFAGDGDTYIGQAARRAGAGAAINGVPTRRCRQAPQSRWPGERAGYACAQLVAFDASQR